MGRWNAESVTGEPWDEHRVGMNVLRPDQPWDSGGPMVLMSDWWVSEHWGRAFDVVALSANVHGQTWPLLRKRDVELTVEELERPSDDPREHMALRNNVRQVERDRARALGELRRRLRELAQLAPDPAAALRGSSGSRRPVPSGALSALGPARTHALGRHVRAPQRLGESPRALCSTFRI